MRDILDLYGIPRLYTLAHNDNPVFPTNRHSKSRYNPSTLLCIASSFRVRTFSPPTEPLSRLPSIRPHPRCLHTLAPPRCPTPTMPTDNIHSSPGVPASLVHTDTLAHPDLPSSLQRPSSKTTHRTSGQTLRPAQLRLLRHPDQSNLGYSKGLL